MNKLVLGLTFLCTALVSSIAQADGWNLKGLDTVAVEYTQSPLVVSQATMMQLDTDTKLKLKSAGLTLASPQDAKAIVEISIHNVKGIVNEWVVVQLTVQEKVQTVSRKSSQKADAITYIDGTLFEVSKGAVDKKVYDTVLNGLVTKLVGAYLDQNSK